VERNTCTQQLLHYVAPFYPQMGKWNDTHMSIVTSLFLEWYKNKQLDFVDYLKQLSIPDVPQIVLY